ncbi:MAG: hypothetical protein JKY31_05045 [Rhodobacteraceae bacterium]|nr:hypothetical protein [Paracoccaceae bacterium]
MTRIIGILVLFMSFSSVAKADYVRCTPDQQVSLEKAVAEAFDALSAATVQITSSNGAYRQWFGVWDAARAKHVRRTIAALKDHIRTSKITYFCAQNGEQNCDSGTYANVFPNDPSTIYICQLYFTLPTLANSDFLEVFNSGTMAGTIIHEMSHYNIVGGTNDNCYNRSVCTAYARNSAGRAVENADSYQYFAEDAFLKQR